jgi:hypothetical protein
MKAERAGKRARRGLLQGKRGLLQTDEAEPKLGF